QALTGRLLMGLPEALHRFVLEGRAGQGLKDAVVQVARQADALLRCGGLLQSPRQQVMIQRGGHVARDDLAQYQVIRREGVLIEREEMPSGALPLHARRQHAFHTEPPSPVGAMQPGWLVRDGAAPRARPEPPAGWPERPDRRSA